MPTVSYETGTNRFERRIGRRLPIKPLEVWMLPPGSPGHRPTPVAGLVTNVSVTGAAIDVPDELDVTPGSTATIQFEGQESKVTVWRFGPTSQPDMTRYGVEFTSLHPDLKHRIYGLLAEGRPAEHEWKDDH